MKRTSLFSLLAAVGLLFAAACASSGSSSGKTYPGNAEPPARTIRTSPDQDPRIGLAPGAVDSPYTGKILRHAAEAIWNLRKVSTSPTPPGFQGVTNSDLSFTGNNVIQGNYNGVIVWDISNPSAPRLAKTYLCPASQSDVSIYKNLLFVSAEAPSARLDCGPGGVRDPVSHDRIRGIRIFDATDLTNAKYISNVQTCRGSHTHTVVSDPKDPAHVYVYISGSSRVRPEGELGGCKDLEEGSNPTDADFRIEVIQVPLANPAQARVVSGPRIFQGLGPAPQHAAPGSRPRTSGPTQCHDITVYPAVGLAGGACGGYGILLDISDVKNPRRIDAAGDPNMSFWHSATFSNDGKKVLYTDEWGGGSAPRCRASDKWEWGSNALFHIENGKQVFKSYFKMPAAQTDLENCVAHNGSLIPIPGREVMVQGWYQGGINVFDWTDAANPVEIAFFDRGPLDEKRMRSAGSWSVYWYNGYIVSSEIARGLDILELVPSPFLTQNEIDAAKTVRYEQLNAQEQPKMVWPASFALARAYLDQLARTNGMDAERISYARKQLDSAQKKSGQARRDQLNALATQMHADARNATDAPKAHTMATAIGDLANATR